MIDTIYVHKSGVGVRRDSVRYLILSEKINMLMYDVPCVCGSLTHRSTRHRDCLLNKKYMDVN